MNPLIALALGIGGLVIGFLLNPVITQLATHPNAANPLPTPRHPLLGGPTWVGVTVALLSAAMAAVLYANYGPTLRALYWFAVSLVLIVTGAVDWKVRLIDVLVLLVATALALVFGPLAGATGIKSALLGAVVGGIVFIFFFMLARFMFPGPGVPFGLGDVYLAIFIGAAVGVGNLGTALFYGIVMAGVAAIVLMALRQMGRGGEPYLAYGTYLCLGTLLFLALWPPL